MTFNKWPLTIIILFSQKGTDSVKVCTWSLPGNAVFHCAHSTMPTFVEPQTLEKNLYDQNDWNSLTGLCFTDINECIDNVHNCDANAVCNNTVGSFTCSCKTGYSGNGVMCMGMCNSYLTHFSD